MGDKREREKKIPSEVKRREPLPPHRPCYKVDDE